MDGHFVYYAHPNIVFVRRKYRVNLGITTNQIRAYKKCGWR